MLQINTLYLHTIGYCVPIFQGNVYKNGYTEFIDKIFIDTYKRKKKPGPIQHPLSLSLLKNMVAGVHSKNN